MTKVEELREEALGMYTDPWYYDPATEVIDALIAAAKEEERERLCNVGYLLTKGEPAVEVSSLWEIMNGENSVVVARCNCYVIPESVLSPAPKEGVKPIIERGRPSQALLDELSEICGDKVTYEPLSLAPKEEK